ncbi:type II toxin-antitoxin system RelE/ParE family toxin [Pedobacter sp.]|uniref:type II toxin-antitoxin system RelE/ParE family toxin n=1 Tax=Pedobacter sp. TaxID=1411316 RepID=UPI003D7FC3CB
MHSYIIKVSPWALNDINSTTIWYNEQSNGLGMRFQKQVIKQINNLSQTAEVYKIRYSGVRCVVVKKFPFMIHFQIENDTVIIFAVLHTSRNPKIWDVLHKRNIK